MLHKPVVILRIVVAEVAAELDQRCLGCVKPVASEVEVHWMFQSVGEGWPVELQGDLTGLAVGVQKWWRAVAGIYFVRRGL